MDELKPCPFCGSTNIDVIEATNYYGSGISRWTCQCGNEECSVLINKTTLTRAQAIEAWNKRV
jgi:Lar family restriction alleviation protein